jgi:arginine N-succinyltransferase
VIGKEHADTGGALHILNNEGFAFSGYVDIFDAGPTIETPLRNIRTVSDSREVSISAIVDEAKMADQAKFIISNCELHNYRMIHAAVAIAQDEFEQITISKQSAKLLAVKLGDTIRIVKH